MSSFKKWGCTLQDKLISNNIGFIIEITNDIFSEYWLNTGLFGYYMMNLPKRRPVILPLELIPDSYSKTQKQIVINAESVKEMYDLLNKLKSRECEYILHRFRFEDGSEYSW